MLDINIELTAAVDTIAMPETNFYKFSYEEYDDDGDNDDDDDHNDDNDHDFCVE